MAVTIDRDAYLELVRDGRTNEQIACHFGCTVRTLDRRRAADPDLNRAIIEARAEIARNTPLPDHGTAARYRRGCRCGTCTSGNTRRHYEGMLLRRQRAGLPPPDPHRGRRRSNAQVNRGGRIDNPSPRTLIEQALARGESTLSIMSRLSVDYAAVKTVRDALLQAAS